MGIICTDESSRSVKFENVPINTTDIQQEELNVEQRTRTNLFAWNGQFSPQFVETILKRYCGSDDVILDMFSGSGTVLVESARIGAQAIGNELNASAYYISKIYEMCNFDANERIKIINQVDNILFNISMRNKGIEEIVNAIACSPDSIVADTLRSLVVLLDVYNNQVTQDRIDKVWSHIKKVIVDLPVSTKPISVDWGDARRLRIQTSSVDFVLTSPPYINVFNYHQKYRASVEALSVDVLQLAKSEFGSNRKHRSNRLYTVIQYCIDIALALKEANRVCKRNARLVFVVGRTSNVLGYSFSNSRLVFIIATRIIGMKLLIRQERSFKNRYGQIIYEDILHFANGDKTGFSDIIIAEGAREVALEVLKDIIDKKNKNNILLQKAISYAPEIQASEIYEH